jgi:hypothetical protein
MQLYADEGEIDIDKPEQEGGSEHGSIVEQGNTAPPTDPDTAPSGPDEMAEDTGSEEEESQFPVRKPRGIINKRSLVLDEDESQVMEVGQGEDAVNSDASEEDEDSEDNVDKERERILSKVWPAVLIKKNAQRERYVQFIGIILYADAFRTLGRRNSNGSERDATKKKQDVRR